MALLNASDFIGSSDNYAIPSGVSDPIFTHWKCRYHSLSWNHTANW